MNKTAHRLLVFSYFSDLPRLVILNKKNLSIDTTEILPNINNAKALKGYLNCESILKDAKPYDTISYLGLSKYIWSQLLPVFNNLLGLLYWDVNL